LAHKTLLADIREVIKAITHPMEIIHMAIVAAIQRRTRI